MKIEIDGKGGPYYSFNKEYRLVNKVTKIIIVGTITSPQGRGLNKDFYYMSPYNPMYRIIDDHFKTSNLVKYKKDGHIPSIIKELNKLGIAFIDVINSCSNTKNSSLDDDLEDIKLDYDSFKDLNESLVLIANSKNAYGALIKIVERNRLKNKIKCVYAFRFYKQSEWDEVFKEVFQR